MKIYTKTGDDGTTGLFGGTRVGKDDPRVQAYGLVDELNCWIGFARAEGLEPSLDQALEDIQHQLFSIGAELATPPEKQGALRIPLVEEEAVVRLESAIDRFEEALSPLKNFILPGGTSAASALHLSRASCRRAERQLVGLCREHSLRPELVRYLNRLSDLLFVMARVANRHAGTADVPWLGRRGAE